jgi:hypothetical protein
MTSRTKLRLHSIEWDTDGENPDLPDEVVVTADDTGIDVPEDGSEKHVWSIELADYLSDKHGWCVRSFGFEVVTPENLELGKKKFLFLVDAPHPNGEDANLAVVAAEARTARDLYVETVVDSGWFDEEEIAGVAIRVMRIHPLGTEYDATPSAAVAWEAVSETTFDPEAPEDESPAPEA